MSAQGIEAKTAKGGIPYDDLYLFYCIWKDERSAELAADKYNEMQCKFYGEEHESR